MNSRRFIALDPKPKDYGSIAGQGRASQQKRASHVHFGVRTVSLELSKCFPTCPRKRT